MVLSPSQYLIVKLLGAELPCLMMGLPWRVYPAPCTALLLPVTVWLFSHTVAWAKYSTEGVKAAHLTGLMRMSLEMYSLNMACPVFVTSPDCI